MEKITLNNKKFTVVNNSKDGKVSGDTTFHFRHKGKVVTAGYQGGVIKHGKIIAKMTADDELEAGKATAKLEVDADGLIRMKLNWEWMDDSKEKGTSEYIEVK